MKDMEKIWCEFIIYIVFPLSNLILLGITIQAYQKWKKLKSNIYLFSDFILLEIGLWNIILTILNYFMFGVAISNL